MVVVAATKPSSRKGHFVAHAVRNDLAVVLDEPPTATDYHKNSCQDLQYDSDGEVLDNAPVVVPFLFLPDEVKVDDVV